MSKSLGENRPAHVRTRAILVLAGMTLFVLGFLMTIDSLPSGGELLRSSEGSGHSPASSLLLLTGFIISLAGVALATIAPAIMFVRARKTKG